MTKEEQNKYMREYYAKHKKELRAYHYKKNKARRIKNREGYNEYMRNYRKRKSVEKVLVLNG